MIRKPLHPILLGQVTMMLIKDFNVANGAPAVDLAKKLIERLRARNMDIVMGSWMDGEAGKERFDWDDVAKLAEEMEERRPWLPPELA